MKTYTFSLLAIALTALATGTVRAQATVEQNVVVDAEPYYNAIVIAELRKQAIVNPMEQLITGADTLDVTAEQVAAITERNAVYTAAAAKEWAAFNGYVKSLGKSFNVADVMPRLNATVTNVLAILAREATATKALLSADQLKAMPADFVSTLESAVDAPAPVK